jgi:hypothetical protein
MSDGYHLADEAARALFDNPLPESSAPLFTATVTAVSYPTVKIRPTRATTAGDQLVGICLGVFPVVNARVVCCWIGGEPVVLGTIAQPAASTTPREFEFPMILYPDTVNWDFFGANSATTASNSDTVNYATNISGDITLPAYGTWRVWVATWQMLSHTAEAGNVRWATDINGTAFNSRNANLNITTTRTGCFSWASVGGLAGGAVVTYAGRYRPNSVASATAGGGDGFAMAWRE